jgi:hypothetical protein
LFVDHFRVKVFSKTAEMESDDEELERAIQLSLQGNQDVGPKRRTDVVDLTEDDDLWPGFEDLEDMEFWKAIASSMGKGKLRQSSKLK